MNEFAMPQVEAKSGFKVRLKSFFEEIGKATVLATENDAGLTPEVVAEINRNRARDGEARRVIVAGQISPGEKPVFLTEPPDAVADISNAEIEKFGL